MRILVTGSRKWNNERFICEVLNQYRDHNPDNPRGTHVLVSGACPDGADKFCEDYAEDVGWFVERWPADWDKHGKRAGYIRNAHMVSLGADLCLAFIKDKSPGATMTAALARKAGIPTMAYNWDSEGMEIKVLWDE